MNFKKLLVKNEPRIKQIAEDNAVKFIGLFGSYARGEQSFNSDVDLLIKFDFSQKQVGFFDLYKVQKKLEDVFGLKVDIVTNPNSLFQPYIDKDLQTIYER